MVKTVFTDYRTERAKLAVKRCRVASTHALVCAL